MRPRCILMVGMSGCPIIRGQGRKAAALNIPRNLLRRTGSIIVELGDTVMQLEPFLPGLICHGFKTPGESSGIVSRRKRMKRMDVSSEFFQSLIGRLFTHAPPLVPPLQLYRGHRQNPLLRPLLHFAKLCISAWPSWSS